MQKKMVLTFFCGTLRIDYNVASPDARCNLGQVAPKFSQIEADPQKTEVHYVYVTDFLLQSNRLSDILNMYLVVISGKINCKYKYTSCYMEYI